MDEQTARYYAEHAEDLAARYESVESPLAPYVPLAFPSEARVLDIGAASGRDAGYLAGLGYRVHAVEPVTQLRELAAQYHPELRGRILPGHLPDQLPTADDLGGPLDGVVCSAVLQHVPRARLFDAVFAIKHLLREHGRALVSIPGRRPESGADGRPLDGRLFLPLAPDELELLFERIGFVTIGRWETADALGRADHTWCTLLFELRSAAESRPLDAIEAVLSPRERKVATYKLALIRALCDIALTQPHLARWRADRRIELPLAAIGARWVLYYWPLLGASTFVPQMSGEWKAGAHKLGFARELRALMDYYAGENGLTTYAVDRRNGTLPGSAQQLERKLLAKLRNVIRAGPVTYAGGSLRTGSGEPRDGRLFDHERGNIIVAAELWKELSLMGHWIQDALILRWAELTADLSQREVSTEQVIALLLTRPIPDRETDAARGVFESVGDLRCVWSDASLRGRSFEVDHLLPYSLWRNNDLWNLLPTAPAINRKKLDRLPTRALLHHRRTAILDCWELTRGQLPARFEAEASAQVGRASSRQVHLPELFDVLVEAVEVTALRRGCERWQP